MQEISIKINLEFRLLLQGTKIHFKVDFVSLHHGEKSDVLGCYSVFVVIQACILKIDVFIHTGGSVFQRGCLLPYELPKSQFHRNESDNNSLKKLIKKEQIFFKYSLCIK